MRLGTQNAGPVKIGDTLYGASLGFDFCAEHEWGIDEWAKRYLGRAGKPTRECYGAPCRTTTRLDPDFAIETVEHDGALWMWGRARYELQYHNLAKAAAGDGTSATKDMLFRLKREPFAAAWDGRGGFCVAATDDEGKAAIHIAQAALADGCCYIIQSGGIFGAGGLKLIDARLIPAETQEDLRRADLSSLALEDAVEACGIRDRLAKAGLRYYALSPRWDDEKAGTFSFWLNPAEQDRNNYGQFTVEELDQWIAGKGPIPKRGKVSA